MVSIIDRIKGDHVFLASLALFAIFILLQPSQIISLPSYVEWNTLFTLASLFLLTTALHESGYLEKFSIAIIDRLRSERSLALTLLLLTFFLSMLITNDVALLVFVPFTLGMQRYLKNDVRKVVIFEAIGANAGSSLTPIGNPQNIFLYNASGMRFLDFIILMTPLVLLLLFILLIFALLSFPGRALEKVEFSTSHDENRKLAYLSLSMLPLFIVAMDLSLEIYLYPLIFLAYLPFFRESYARVDWLLLAVFLLFFLDFGMVANVPFIRSLFSSLELKGASSYLLSSLLSQVISNVPAAIFLAQFSSDYPYLLYGVNVGGNGTLMSSLANLIAIRFLRDRRAILDFHRYSIPFFLLSLGAAYLLITL